jgi:hypothetical protein
MDIPEDSQATAKLVMLTDACTGKAAAFVAEVDKTEKGYVRTSPKRLRSPPIHLGDPESKHPR